MTEKKDLNRRPGPILRALDDSSTFCQPDDLVVAGDFNNNPQWDKPNGPNNMSRISQVLTDRGLVSLYHYKTGLPFGEEIQNTYWYWHRFGSSVGMSAKGQKRTSSV